jgi:type I restriction enzyme M protein
MLSNYDLGYKWVKYKEGYSKSHKLLKGQVPDILFIEQCLNLLKPGGRLGIVLPNGHFENASMDYLREYIKNQEEHHRIKSWQEECEEFLKKYGFTKMKG